MLQEMQTRKKKFENFFSIENASCKRFHQKYFSNAKNSKLLAANLKIRIK